MSTIRQPAVAGSFYPKDPTALRAQIKRLLSEANPSEKLTPKAIIVPHAGYVYSGPVAASVFALLAPLRKRINRVILLGPSHRIPFFGLAYSHADFFATPLGEIPIDHEAIKKITDLPYIHGIDEAHQWEHSLEVQLPFLQTCLDEFSLIPLVIGEANAEQVATVLERLWVDPQTLVVISSDLSHYHDYDTAKRMDSLTCKAIEACDPDAIDFESACGRNGVNGLLTLAARRDLHVHTVDLRNSGDTAGPRDQVVGYGAWVLD